MDKRIKRFGNIFGVLLFAVILFRIGYISWIKNSSEEVYTIARIENVKQYYTGTIRVNYIFKNKLQLLNATQEYKGDIPKNYSLIELQQRYTIVALHEKDINIRKLHFQYLFKDSRQNDLGKSYNSLQDILKSGDYQKLSFEPW